MKTVLRAIVSTVALIVLIPLVLMPALAGWVVLPITSSALEPQIRAGSVVVVDPIDPQAEGAPSVQVGDVVTFTPQLGSSELATRRVASIADSPDGRRLTFAPGGRSSADELSAQAGQVRALARYHLPYAGTVLSWVPPTHRPWWARALGILALSYAAWQLWRRREELPNPEGGRDEAVGPHQARPSRSAARRGRREVRRDARSRATASVRSTPGVAARLDALAGLLLSARRSSGGRHRATPEQIVASVRAQEADVERVSAQGLQAVGVADPGRHEPGGAASNADEPGRPGPSRPRTGLTESGGRGAGRAE
ncbi:S24/S26 family peptidase [Gephyromycinifex aptenodytis]|uniref:hypothetical protein n=1 Tax=Gephyromycinifex aptenodytis TaxID=2716227 RepID=UPI00144510E2|nr:hypothetical protein [Gephyromycinifex aptenodytis]